MLWKRICFLIGFMILIVLVRLPFRSLEENLENEEPSDLSEYRKLDVTPSHSSDSKVNAIKTNRINGDTKQGQSLQQINDARKSSHGYFYTLPQNMYKSPDSTYIPDKYLLLSSYTVTHEMSDFSTGMIIKITSSGTMTFNMSFKQMSFAIIGGGGGGGT